MENEREKNPQNATKSSCLHHQAPAAHQRSKQNIKAPCTNKQPGKKRIEVKVESQTICPQKFGDRHTAARCMWRES